MTEHRLTLTGLAAKYAVSHAAHHVFSPSGSGLWMNCPGGLIPNLLAPDDSGYDAAYGTVGHGVGEIWLKTKKKPRHLLGTDEWIKNGGRVYEITIDEEMLDFVQQYVDWCILLPGDHFVETHVDFSEFTPLPYQGGTSDHAAAGDGWLIITDLKLGKGVKVFAKGNTQLMLYALGFFLEYEEWYVGGFQTIELRIAQPRLNHFDTHTITRDELLEFAELVRERSHAAWNLDAPRVPSPKACEWCKVKATCAANVVLQQRLSEEAFAHLDDEVVADDIEALREKLDDGDAFQYPQVMTLSVEDMERLLPYGKFVESWWKALRAEVMRRAANGEKLKTLKLVEGRSKRVFANPTAAGDALIKAGCKRDEVFEQTIVSPSQAEKLLRKAGHRGNDLPEILNGLVRKPPGKPTLAPISYKRPVLTDVSAEAFASMDENPETDEID